MGSVFRLGLLFLFGLLVLQHDALAQGKKVDCDEVRGSRASRVKIAECRASCEDCPNAAESAFAELDLTIKCDETCEKKGDCPKKGERCAIKELANKTQTNICLDPSDDCPARTPALCIEATLLANCRCECKDKKTADEEQEERRKKLKELKKDQGDDGVFFDLGERSPRGGLE